MNYDHIRFCILNVYKECHIASFPINCFDILASYRINTHAYSSLNDELRSYCLSYSNDALFYKDKICYNDNQPAGRIRFSLMHELGHVILRHSENHTPRMEQEANVFASNILAPRMAIHYAACRNFTDVAKIFGLTNEAGRYAFDDYRQWHRKTVLYKMGSFDLEIYQHFYNSEAERFVYNIKQCYNCGQLLYNSVANGCVECSTKQHRYFYKQDPDPDFLIAESQWLYKGI